MDRGHICGSPIPALKWQNNFCAKEEFINEEFITDQIELPPFEDENFIHIGLKSNCFSQAKVQRLLTDENLLNQSTRESDKIDMLANSLSFLESEMAPNRDKINKSQPTQFNLSLGSSITYVKDERMDFMEVEEENFNAISNGVNIMPSEGSYYNSQLQQTQIQCSDQHQIISCPTTPTKTNSTNLSSINNTSVSISSQSMMEIEPNLASPFTVIHNLQSIPKQIFQNEPLIEIYLKGYYPVNQAAIDRAKQDPDGYIAKCKKLTDTTKGTLGVKRKNVSKSFGKKCHSFALSEGIVFLEMFYFSILNLSKSPRVTEESILSTVATLVDTFKKWLAPKKNKLDSTDKLKKVLDTTPRNQHYIQRKSFQLIMYHFVDCEYEKWIMTSGQMVDKYVHYSNKEEMRQLVLNPKNYEWMPSTKE